MKLEAKVCADTLASLYGEMKGKYRLSYNQLSKLSGYKRLTPEYFKLMESYLINLGYGLYDNGKEFLIFKLTWMQSAKKFKCDDLNIGVKAKCGDSCACAA